ncbi:imidazole glycerol phosphate synthase subunit HisH [Synechococcus sp. UW69]|uniref:imidazole glycerol phosphate synthase subunit HisH n=1 Tax=Synechococcus sp. UW69 TaxID=368493 RepID=UPI000E0E7CBD|nr:imidazole glycerol phosphate synthase subunit HisH [Synechococcus sp. UW69]
MIYIVPFNFCNLQSIYAYMHKSNHDYLPFTSDVSLQDEDVIIIPGVGTFAEGMKFLQQQEFTKKIVNHFLRGNKIIGICLGMQLFFQHSEESPNIEGLSIIEGSVTKLKKDSISRIPHLGWNEMSLNTSSGDQIFDDLVKAKDFYFVHSYECCPSNKNLIIASVLAENHHEITAIVKSRMTFGLQFHPEKSGPAGFKLLHSIINNS